MAYVFFTLGWITLIAGLVWSFAAAASVGSFSTSIYALPTALAVMAPGLAVVVTGLLFLAIGSALMRLNEIARYARIAHKENKRVSARRARDAGDQIIPTD